MCLLVASQCSVLGFSLAPGTIDREKKQREGWMCAIDHADFSLRAFFHCLPTFSIPPFRCSWPLIFDSACLWNGRPGPAPAGSPSFCRLGCAASTRSSGPASPSFTPQSLINGYSHRSHCFTEGGKSKSNIFHISSASRRIDTDVCSIYPQTCTAEGNALRARHSAVPHGCNWPMRQRPWWRSFHTRAKVQLCLFSSLLGGAVVVISF